jgi:hypothetical protein
VFSENTGLAVVCPITGAPPYRFELAAMLSLSKGGLAPLLPF